MNLSAWMRVYCAKQRASLPVSTREQAPAPRVLRAEGARYSVFRPQPSRNPPTWAARTTFVTRLRLRLSPQVSRSLSSPE